jgi:hypothetical protein
MPVPMGGVGVTKFAPEAPTLMGATNLAAAPNVGNAFGAWGRRRYDRRRFRLAVGGLDIAKMGHSPGIEHPDAAAPGCSIVILHQRSQVAASQTPNVHGIS